MKVNQPAPWTADHDWPRTSRIMPWLLALFAGMLFLLPFDAAKLPVSLPVDAQLDRFVLGAIFLLWICSIAAGGRFAPRLRWSGVHAALAVFLAAAVASVLVNLETLVNLGEHGLALRKLATLLSFVALFLFVASVVRPTEVEAFVRLIVALACITAVGVVYESRTHTNIFYEWVGGNLPGFELPPPPITQGVDEIGRLKITGPTSHGLALTTMMAMVVPFAVLMIMDNRRRVLGMIAAALLLAGAVSTLRKTAFVAPAAAMVVMVAYRPVAMAKLLPFGVVLIIMIHYISPGSLGRVGVQIFGGNLTTVGSTEARTEDYAATRPDVTKNLAFGRGYGTYDSRRYRYTDNMLLHLVITVGLIGLAAYLLVILSVMIVAHRALRSSVLRRAGPALGATAAAVAFAATSSLYDTLGFPQAPYLFLLIAGLAVATAERTARSPARATLPVRPTALSPQT